MVVGETIGAPDQVGLHAMVVVRDIGSALSSAFSRSRVTPA